MTSQPCFTPQQRSPLLRTLLRTLPQNPRTLKSVWCRMTPEVCTQPLCCKSLCCASRFFAQVAEELWAADPSKCPMGHEANASSGTQLLGGRFGYFLFFLLGEGEGEVRGGRERGGVGRLLKENPRRGVSRGGRGRGAGRVSAANWGIAGGGGAKYFLGGLKCPPRYSFLTKNRFLSSAGVGKSCDFSLLRVPNPSPTRDKNLASMAPGISSSKSNRRHILDLCCNIEAMHFGTNKLISRLLTLSCWTDLGVEKTVKSCFSQGRGSEMPSKIVSLRPAKRSPPRPSS